MTFALAVVAGALIGLSLGALGGGGSILAVPVLVALGQGPGGRRARRRMTLVPCQTT